MIYRLAGGGAARSCAVTVAAVLFAMACGSSQSALPGLAWHLRALHADPQRSVGRGDGVVIAFIDTGFGATALLSFAGRVLGGVNELTGDTTTFDGNGHGTEMAVIAAGGGDQGVWGVAPDATVMPVVVADADGHASPEAIAAGIRSASAHRAAVINISMASAVSSQAVADAIQAASEAGIFVVASAGDLGLPGPEFPASAPGAIAVYGEDPAGQIGVHSNVPIIGGVLAPGESIETLVPLGGGVHKLAVNGTSAAAAVVSGLLAACLSASGPNYSTVQRRYGRCKQLLLTRPAGQFLDLSQIVEAVK